MLFLFATDGYCVSCVSSMIPNSSKNPQSQIQQPTKLSQFTGRAGRPADQYKFGLTTTSEGFNFQAMQIRVPI